MSQADASSFVERAAKDVAFGREVSRELQQGAVTSLQRLVELGVRHGMSFTEAELTGALTGWRKANQEELSDTELDAVAGGWWMSLGAIVQNSQKKTREIEKLIIVQAEGHTQALKGQS
jgi:hypothetical protein